MGLLIRLRIRVMIKGNPKAGLEANPQIRNRETHRMLRLRIDQKRQEKCSSRLNCAANSALEPALTSQIAISLIALRSSGGHHIIGRYQDLFLVDSQNFCYLLCLIVSLIVEIHSWVVSFCCEIRWIQYRVFLIVMSLVSRKLWPPMRKRRQYCPSRGRNFKFLHLGHQILVPSHKGRIKVDIVRSFTQRKAVHMGIVVRFFMMSSRRIERVWQ